jgi:hypothetical protein
MLGYAEEVEIHRSLAIPASAAPRPYGMRQRTMPNPDREPLYWPRHCGYCNGSAVFQNRDTRQLWPRAFRRPLWPPDTRDLPPDKQGRKSSVSLLLFNRRSLKFQSGVLVVDFARNKSSCRCPVELFMRIGFGLLSRAVKRESFSRWLALRSGLEHTPHWLIAKDHHEGKKGEAAGKPEESKPYDCGCSKRNRSCLLNASNQQSLWGPKTIGTAVNSS